MSQGQDLLSVNRNLHPQQFEQLKMFMTPDEVIDSTEKFDTDYRVMHRPPRDQWAHPQSGGHEPLRDYKLRRAQEKEWADKPYETMPPLHLVRGMNINGKTYDKPMLMDGHHRLALAEHRSHPYVAVVHHNNEDEWDEYGYDASNWGSGG